MNVSKAEIKKQFNRAKAKDWLPYFEEAANEITAGYFDAADLMGIASRETNLDPRWLTKAGDRGHGYGLMQADVRSFPEWISSGKWRDAREGILKGAEILMQKLADTQDSIGKRRSAKSSKTSKLSWFTGKDVRGVELQQVTIAAYNAGRWGHYAVSNDRDADTYTTGKDYSSDVIARAREFRALLNAETQSSAAVAPMPEVVNPSGNLMSQRNETPADIQAGPIAALPETQPPIDSASEVKATSASPDGTQTVEVTAKNEQDVNIPAKVDGGAPYNGIGFVETVKSDVKAIGLGNLSFQGLETYFQNASGWPPWVVALITKAALVVAVVSVGWVLFRLVHYLVDRWQNNERVKTEAAAKTAIDRKDIKWV